MNISADSGEEASFKNKNRKKIFKLNIKNCSIFLFATTLIIIGSLARVWTSQPALYAHAYSGEKERFLKIKSPLLETSKSSIFDVDKNKENLIARNYQGKHFFVNGSSGEFAGKLYEIVGESPIKEMIPFIAKRDKRTAAFLVAIAKKESSFGEHAPSLDGQDCHNYWGYKGSAGRGKSLGYACFASPEEAIEIVGNRIEVLVNKDHNTPARMVNTWKCGTSCAGDPGAPGWVSTVALYFEKIVS
jgi:hypothetical protein